MASESTEERTVSVDLPAELADWLDEQATTREVAREELLVQLLASYRETSQFDGEFEDIGLDGETLADSLDDELEEAVTNVLVDVLDDHLDERVADSVKQQFGDALESEVEAAVESAVTSNVNEATNAVQRQLESRIESVQTEFREKLDDVRSRVIQVKKETDKKAPADHSHPELDQVQRLRAEIDSLETDLASLQAEHENTVPDQGDRLDTHTEELEQLQDRLQTIAWVVSDLREAQQSGGGIEAVERIKRAAAQADIERAECENCGSGVNLSLLTEPKCPHCDATVSNVDPSSGWFSSPTLRVASQLESGETNE